MFMHKSRIGGAAHAWSTYNGFLKQRKHHKEADSGSGEILKVVSSFPVKISNNQQNVTCPCENREQGRCGKGRKRKNNNNNNKKNVSVTTEATISKEPKKWRCQRHPNLSKKDLRTKFYLKKKEKSFSHTRTQ